MSSQNAADTFFSVSPFSNVADEFSAHCWSGRPKVHEALLRMKRSLDRLPDSTLDLVWANLGAGKSHTLMHLAYLLQGESPTNSTPVSAFVEMPEGVRSFLDLYRPIIESLPLEQVASIVGASAKLVPVDLARAANVIINGDVQQKEVVADWLSGRRPLLKDLRQCSGISQRIEDDVTATNILSGIVHAFSFSKVRLVVLVDEFQRIGVLKRQAARDAVLSCLRSIFSRSPRYFSLVLSVQSMLEQNALGFLPKELQTLLGRKPTISLPEMDLSEAKDFLIGRFAFFRPPDYNGTPTAPFEPDTVEAVLSFIRDDAGVRLSPREILQAFGFVYGQAENPAEGISTSEALGLLRAGYVQTTP